MLCTVYYYLGLHYNEPKPRLGRPWLQTEREPGGEKLFFFLKASFTIVNNNRLMMMVMMKNRNATDDGDADEDTGGHVTLLSCFWEFRLLWPSCFELFIFSVLFSTG